MAFATLRGPSSTAGVLATTVAVRTGTGYSPEGGCAGVVAAGIVAGDLALVNPMTDLRQQLRVYEDLGFDVADVDVTGLLEFEREDAVLVLPHALVPMQELIAKLRLPGKQATGILVSTFEDPDRYRPVDPGVPRERPYLIHGFEPGVEYLNVPPREALPRIAERDRLAATIEEGLAAFAQQPEVLQRNKCFSLAGSTRGDKRVPALWISANAPKLGWCFAGAPHTWLGTASVAGRQV